MYMYYRIENDDAYQIITLVKSLLYDYRNSKDNGKREKDMVQQIMHDPLFLAQNTLKAHREGCVGMAANMIGVKKNIIIVNMGFFDVVMFNPVIVSKSGAYETEEGCLSLSGIRKTTRFENIEVEYQDFSWKKQRQKLSGWTAQIVQHEVDHCNGILI